MINPLNPDNSPLGLKTTMDEEPPSLLETIKNTIAQFQKPYKFSKTYPSHIIAASAVYTQLREKARTDLMQMNPMGILTCSFIGTPVYNVNTIRDLWKISYRLFRESVTKSRTVSIGIIGFDDNRDAERIMKFINSQAMGGAN